MSTLKKHLTSNVNHALPTYKKLPPIQTPPPTKDKDTPRSQVFTVRGVASPQSLPASNKGHRESPTTGVKLVGHRTADRSNVNNVKSVAKMSSLKGNEDGMEDSSSEVKLTGFRQTSTMADKPQTGSGWTPLGSEIPPCRICGDKASGLHYGVYTCEACKAFFRRILKRKTLDFQCTCTAAEKKLGIDVPRKFTCQKCRYDRCIKEGMSKDAIKIGRYTITRKRQNDREVKMLRGDRRLSEGSSKSTSSASPYSGYEGSPEDASLDVSVQSTDDAVMTKSSKRLRKEVNSDDEGQLYQSLTNSIFQSLLQNKQQSIPVITAADNASSDTSLLEKLYTQPFNPRQQDIQPIGIQNPNHVTSIHPIASKNESHVTRILVAGQKGNEFKDLSSVTSVVPQKVELPNPFSLPPKTQDYSSYMSANKVDLFPAPFQEGPADLNNEESPIETLLNQPTDCPHNVKLPMSVDSGIADHDNMFADESVDFGTLPLDDNPMTPNIDLLQDDIISTGDLNDQLVLAEGEFPSEFPATDITGGMPVNIVSASKLDYMASEMMSEPIGDSVDEAGDFDIEDFLDSIDLDIDSHMMEIVGRYEKPVLSVGNGITIVEIDEIVSQLTDSAMALYMDTCTITCEQIRNKHAEYLEQYQLKLQLFGNMANLSKEEYFAFYNQTGIDIDNRQQFLIEALKHFEDSAGKLVKFAKCIPGFPELDVDDQVNLLKGSRYAYDLIRVGRYGPCLKTQNLTVTPWNKVYHIDEIEKIFPKDYMQLKMECSKRIYQLGLTSMESIIARAVAITFYGCCCLKDSVKVVALHNKLVACLEYHLNQRPADKPLSITDIICNLISLQGLVKREKEVMQELFETWPISSNHKLVKEFVT